MDNHPEQKPCEVEKSRFVDGRPRAERATGGRLPSHRLIFEHRETQEMPATAVCLGLRQGYRRGVARAPAGVEVDMGCESFAAGTASADVIRPKTIRPA